MWFKNATIYEIKSMSLADVESDLKNFEFTPLTGMEAVRSGWVAPVDDGLAYRQGDNVLLNLRTDKKLLPSSVVAAAVKARADEIEEREGYRPGRKQLRELKEEVTDTLLAKAFSVSTCTSVWIDASAGLLAIDTASASRADAVVSILMRSLEGLQLRALKVVQAPAAALTSWLAECEAPLAFSLDQDAELVSRGSDGSRVRYSRHSLEGVEIAGHIKAGKNCTQLALTWADKVSFVLTDTMTIKRIKPLDVIAQQSAEASDDQFASDFTLMTGELARMLDDLIRAFGGILHTKEDEAQAA